LGQHGPRYLREPGPAPAGPPTAEEIRDTYAVVLGRPGARVGDSFVGLGGDSLSYVEV
jgi:hypothetical protein